MKRKIIYLAAVLFLVLMAIGCENDEKHRGTGEIEYEVAEGGEITVPLSGFETLNPIIKGSQSSHYFSKLIFEGLFSVKEDLDVEQALAESYVISEDAKSIDIVLKEGVRFHSGEELTAEDIAFTIEVIKESGLEKNADIVSPLYRIGGLYDGERVADVNVKSKNEIEIKFDKPFSDAPEYLTFPILSKKSLGTVESALKKEDYVAVGTGPYVVETVDALKEVVLLKNKDYRIEEPNIDVIRGKVLAEREVAKTSFEAGRVHVISDLNYLNWESYAQNDKVHISSFPSNRYEFISFNFRKEIFQEDDGKKMREAVSYSVNRENILKNIYLGYGEIVDSPVNPASWLSTTKEEGEKYDIEKAVEKLGEIGYADVDGDGALENEDGEKASLTVIAPPNSQARIDTARAVSESLRKIGFIVEEDYDMTAKVYETEEEEEQDWAEFEAKLSGESYDLAVLGMEMSYLPDMSFSLHSENIGTSNFSGYSDKKLDELLNKANSSGNREEKKGVYGEIQKYIKEEKPYISIIYTDAAMINYKRIAGELNPNYMDIYRGIENWFVPKEFQESEEK